MPLGDRPSSVIQMSPSDCRRSCPRCSACASRQSPGGQETRVPQKPSPLRDRPSCVMLASSCVRGRSYPRGSAHASRQLRGVEETRTLGGRLRLMQARTCAGQGCCGRERCRAHEWSPRDGPRDFHAPFLLGARVRMTQVHACAGGRALPRPFEACAPALSLLPRPTLAARLSASVPAKMPWLPPSRSTGSAP